jgi:hypothetical protein
VRVLSEGLEAAQAAVIRRPAYKVLAFDPSLDSMADIVSGRYSQVPLDFTPYCTGITWAPDKLDFTLSDPDGLFHPDSGAQRKYVADGTVIRLREGGETVEESDWVWSFTGFIRGQIGWQKSRRTGSLYSQVTAFSRENSQALKRRNITSKEYTAGTELGIMLQDILQTFLGLSDNEIRIPSILGLQLRHKTNQISQMAPWDAITKLLESVSKIPCFDGDGRLTFIDKNLNRMPDRILPGYIRIYDYQVPARNQDTINKVRVVFLDSELTKVESPYQCLGTAQVTTGFFSMHETLPVWWSEDHTQRAYNTKMVVKKSVNSGLLPVGTETYKEIDEFHGQIEVAISVWVPILATVMLAEYLAAAAIPDKTQSSSANLAPVELEGVVAGMECTVLVTPGQIQTTEEPWTAFTIPWGRVLQAQAMVAISLIMMSMGSAQYEIWGIPYDYAYVEQESIAIQAGLSYWDENEKEIRNDFLGSYEQSDTLAMTELTWEVSNSMPRRLVIDDDLSLERGDILQLPDGRKFMITDMSKAIRRGEVPQLTLEGFKVLKA